MFVELSKKVYTTNPGDIFELSPRQIAHGLDALWEQAQAYLPQKRCWHHLIYAFMIENTRIVEIFRRVIFEYTHGEELATPNSNAHHWLRLTEMLFFRSAPGSASWSVESDIRNDTRAVRRNAYYRMFGMDLNHGTDDNQAIPYHKPKAANNDFARFFQELLCQLWIGYTNAKNQTGPNQTDDEAILTICRKLGTMLRLRRSDRMLSHEEFYAVALTSYLHLTVSFNSPILIALRADTDDLAPESERLNRVAQRVNLPAHRRSQDYFDMAMPMSRLLIALELGVFNSTDAVRTLYTPSTGNWTQDVLTVIDRWSSATGHDLKNIRSAATTLK